jgi:peptide/nickel transport system permease protein
MTGLRNTLKELAAYPSAVVGLVIVFILVGISIYTIIAIPYDEAVRLWRGSEADWYNSPKFAAPVWTNLFTTRDRPETIIRSSQPDAPGQPGGPEKSVTEISEEMWETAFALSFDYEYDDFPQEISIFFNVQYDQKAPHVDMAWLTPDGREIRMSSISLEGSPVYRTSQDKVLRRRLGGEVPHVGLLAQPDTEDNPVALRGTYELQVSSITFEPESTVDAELVLFGQVQGLAGTDHRRRDLMIALLWGTPIALAFGLLAAVGTTITTLAISGVGTWFGGWVDELIQRVTEVNMVLPFLPILIMVGTFYSKSLWLMLGVVILLSIFTGAIKTYRAMFIQVKASPYIEAAQAYGASNWRIIFRYLVPRIIPMIIPALVVAIPGFVFLEAALAVLGLGDPILPTWGKVINEARTNGALYQGRYYWVLEPSVLLIVTGLAFSLLGFSLDRIFNPRLRGL